MQRRRAVTMMMVTGFVGLLAFFSVSSPVTATDLTTPIADVIVDEGWVVIDGDLALPDELRQIQQAVFDQRAELYGNSAFVPQALTGNGFAVIDGFAGNRGSYTIRLVDSAGIESLRPGLELAAARLADHTGGYFVVAPGTTTATEPVSGEILVVVSSTSPCGGNWAGCAGPRSAEFDPVAGQWFLVTGKVWIHPTALTYSQVNRQHLLEHEIGHALGLLHYDSLYEGRYQVMHSMRYDAATFESGDVNGLNYLHPTAPTNDPFSAPRAVPSSGTVDVLATYGATREPGEPSHADLDGAGSVWYSWTAPSTGVAEINTFGSGFDTVLAVYTGSSLSTLSEVAANDVGDPVLGGFSRVVFPVVEGQSYRVAVDGREGGAGVARTNFVAPTANRYTPMNPVRIVDTRSGIGYGGGKIGPHMTLQVQIGGAVGIPFGATAAVLNVTVTDPEAAGYLTVYPCDSPVLGSSSLNYPVGATIPNLVVSRTSVNNSQVCIYSKSNTHVVVDVNGYYTPTTGHDYTPIQPTRVLDTRDGHGAGRTTALSAGETFVLAVSEIAELPGGVAAAAMNVTATQAQGSGFVTVWPCHQPRPTAANLNFTAGQTFPNFVVAGVDPDGSVCLYAHTAVHLVVDLNGYFRPGGTKLSPLTPSRLLDTRAAVGTPTTTKLDAGHTLVVDVWGNGGVPAGAESAVVNLAVTGTEGSGFVTMWPCDQPRPTAANLNFTANQTVANLAVTDLDSHGRLCLYTLTRTHVVLDVSGYTS